MAAWEPIASVLLVVRDPLQSAPLVQALLEDGLEVLQRPFALQSGSLLPPVAEARSFALVILVWPALAGDPSMACAAVARWRRSDGVTPLLVLPDQADEEERAALRLAFVHQQAKEVFTRIVIE